MKIRTGFVSNSSSSSFILDDRYEDIFQAAEQMINLRNEEWADWDREKEWVDPDLPNLRKARQMNVDPDTPVTFKTTNYDTFMFKKRGVIYVSTCNNIDWSEMRTTYHGGGHDEGEWYDYEKETYFWDIRDDFIGKPVTDEEWKEFKKANPELFKKSKEYSWPSCWKNERHWDGIVKSVDGKIMCKTCWKESGAKGMLLVPKKPANLTPVRKRIRFR